MLGTALSIQVDFLSRLYFKMLLQTPRIFSALVNRIRGVCPIVNITFTKTTDPSSWRINFAPEATEHQKREAQLIITNIDLTAEAAKPKPPTREETLETTVADLEARLAALEARTREN